MRADGKRIKNADPMYTIIPYIMSKRYDAMNMITLDIPAEPIEEYIKKNRKEERFISHMAVIMTAYLRTAREFPRLNRFIANKKIYERNEFCVALVILKPGDDNATMPKVYFELDDDIFAVQKKIEQFVSENKKEDTKNSLDKLMGTLLKIPGLLNTAVGALKVMDKFGLLPKKLIDASPFHTSMTFSNLASIRTNHIYHHTYEFGTTSVFITMGNKRYVPLRVKGEPVMTECIPLGVVMDERICSGSYFARAFARIRKYLNEPELLEGAPVDVGEVGETEMA